MTIATHLKEEHLIGVTYMFTGLVFYHRGVTWWHAGTQGAGEGAESLNILTCRQWIVV